MENEPKVSIVIALYNTEIYIEKCIESTICQTYKNIEVIIVDDGSTDKSFERCQAYLDDNRVVLLHKENGGLSSARQMGLEHATGEYVCFIDADDYLEEVYVEKLLNRLLSTNADICLCYSRFILGDKEWTVGYDLPEETYKATKSNLESHYRDQCAMFFMSDSWNKMYKTDFIRSSGVKFELPPKMNGTDLAFNHKLAMHYPQYTTCSDVLYNHILLENSAVRRRGKKLLNSYNTIMGQLLNEADGAGILQPISNQLNSIYIRFIRDGLADAVKESSGIKEVRVLVHEAHLLHEDMYNSYPNMKNAKYISCSKSLDLFNHCFGHEKLTTLYLVIHRMLKKYIS